MKSLKRVEGINVVPLIDIMLVLLAIVLTISSFIALGKLDITLPKASSATSINPKNHEIVISKDKKFYFDKQEIDKELLSVKLDILTKEDNIIISADKGSLYEDFIFVVDILKQKKLTKISMVVQK